MPRQQVQLVQLLLIFSCCPPQLHLRLGLDCGALTSARPPLPPRPPAMASRISLRMQVRHRFAHAAIFTLIFAIGETDRWDHAWVKNMESLSLCVYTQPSCFYSWCVTSCSKRSSASGSSGKLQGCSTCSIAWPGPPPPPQPSALHSITKICRFPWRFWRSVTGL